MNESTAPRKARFQVGDHVRAVGPSASRREETGMVSEVIGVPAKNAVYRYRVTFSDGGSDMFYGFELEPLRDTA